MHDFLDLTKDLAKGLLGIVTNRVVWLMAAAVLLFFVLFVHLFDLQIVRGGDFVRAPLATTTEVQTISAPRGNIFDRFGRPLTMNISAHIVTIDPSLARNNPHLNEAMLELTRILERGEEDFANEFPMTTQWPYEFTIPGEGDVRRRREFRWKDDLAIPDPDTATAADSFLYLREFFDIDEEMSNEDARRILNFVTMIFVQRFNRENPRILVATDVSAATIAAIEENSELFMGVNIEMTTLREYTGGEYFSHILGYTGRISDEALEANRHLGYTPDDFIGKTGLEISMESYLRGAASSQTVEVIPATGRRVSASPEIVPALPGNDIFLTFDMEMQRRTYYILKQYLTDIVVGRIQGRDGRYRAPTPQAIFANMVRAGWVPVRAVMQAEDAEGTANLYILRRFVLENLDEPDDGEPTREPSNEEVRAALIAGINSGRISGGTMLLALMDLEILSDTDNFAARARTSRNLSGLIIEKLRQGELTPQMINTDPSTGSVVVVDVQTGAVLAAVGYPLFDNNRLANRIDPEYFERINVLDSTAPTVNRPFQEAIAPGSTFKMFTGAAGLETGVITPRSTIRDGVVYTRAGRPHARCWHRGGHGSINVAQAIAVSCNYFFFETSMRLGSNRFERIETLNRYMEFFGLDERSGVEVGEFADNFNRNQVAHVMSSPAFKEFQVLRRNEFAALYERDWFDGDTIRTAIGQGHNSISAAQMARAMAQIANRGTRHSLHLVDRIVDYDGQTVRRNEHVPNDTGMEFAESTWDAIHDGMLRTTRGPGGGTAINHFRRFPIAVGGKTGTAEQVATRPSHTSFGGFAPFEDPQIAVFVSIPFGDTRIVSAAATQVARDVIYAFLRPDTHIEPSVERNRIVR